MTGNKEEHNIECLLQDLKNRIKLDLEDKDEADPRIADVYKDLVRKNRIDEEKTPTALQDSLGYVMDIPVPALINPTHSESQSISSLCDSHLCPSCESAAYDTDSSGSTRHLSAKSRRCNPALLPISMQLHQTSNHRMRNSSVDVGTSVCRNSTSHVGTTSDNTSYVRRYTDHRTFDTGSETTSGVSSQDFKGIKGSVTSDSETQTDDIDRVPSSGETGEPQQTVFYLDKYTHLTKRKRNRGIPNVCRWFGMGAVEHLIQNSVTCNSWIWSSPDATKVRSCSSKNGSTNTIGASAPISSPQTSSSELKRSSPCLLPEIDEWESEKNLLEVLSDVGETILDNISPVSSRRSSRRSSIVSNFSPDLSHVDGNKKKKGNRLLVPGLGGIKNSIITKVRSPNRSRKIVTNNKQKSSKNSLTVDTQSDVNGVLQSAISTLSSSSSSSKSKDDYSVDKQTDDSHCFKTLTSKSSSHCQAKANGNSLADTRNITNEALKTAQLTEILNDEFGEGDLDEKQKKRNKRNGGAGGGRFRGGGTMMKCAMFDEFVEISKSKEPEMLKDLRHRRPDPHHGWRDMFRSEMRTKAYQDSHFADVAKEIEKRELIQEVDDMEHPGV